LKHAIALDMVVMLNTEKQKMKRVFRQTLVLHHLFSVNSTQFLKSKIDMSIIYIQNFRVVFLKHCWLLKKNIESIQSILPETTSLYLLLWTTFQWARSKIIFSDWLLYILFQANWQKWGKIINDPLNSFLRTKCLF
jgi:CRISPR/Cas system-associated protein endoribonuclease Cas2